MLKPMELMVEASPRRVYPNAHTYHINSISVNSDQETYLSADDLRVNLWHLDITDQSFNIVDIKPANMEELTEVITAAEFHPTDCSHFVYSSSKGVIRLCDMRQSALCDKHAKCKYGHLVFACFFALTNNGVINDNILLIQSVDFELKSSSCRHQAMANCRKSQDR